MRGVTFLPIIFFFSYCSCYVSNGRVFEDESTGEAVDANTDHEGTLEDGENLPENSDRDNDILENLEDEVDVSDEASIPCNGDYIWQRLNRRLPADCYDPVDDRGCYNIFLGEGNLHPVDYFQAYAGEERTYSFLLGFINADLQPAGIPVELPVFGTDNTSNSGAASLFDNTLLYFLEKVASGAFFIGVVQYSMAGDLLLADQMAVNESASSIAHRPVWTGSEYHVIFSRLEGGAMCQYVARYSPALVLIDEVRVDPLYEPPLPPNVITYQNELYWMSDHYMRIEYIYFSDGGGGVFASHWDVEAGQLDERVLIDFQETGAGITLFNPQIWNGESYIVLFGIAITYLEAWYNRYEMLRMDRDFNRIGDPVIISDKPSTVIYNYWPKGQVVWNGGEYLVVVGTLWSDEAGVEHTERRFIRFDKDSNMIQDWIFSCVGSPLHCPKVGSSVYPMGIGWTGDRFVATRPCADNIEENCLDYLICEE